MPTCTMSSRSSGPRLRNREAAYRTRDMFISISVLRAYWYSGVPSSSTASWSKKSRDSSRASLGATFEGSATVGSRTASSWTSVFRVVAAVMMCPPEFVRSPCRAGARRRQVAYPDFARTVLVTLVTSGGADRGTSGPGAAPGPVGTIAAAGE
ncbi:hypothetical protein SFUMM280S_04122 [Streptomyces fumanus]